MTRVAWQILPATLLLQLGGAMAQINQDQPVLAVGDPLRGEAIVSSRQTGLCLLCHSAPVGDARFQGNLAPSLAGAGKRWTAAQLRQRVANPRSLNPDSIMPAYASTDGLNRVGSAWVGQPLLTGQQIEDVVAFLLTLQD